MSAILPFVKIDLDPFVARHFMPHQANWIEAENSIHALHKQAYALAEKSVRIGWTRGDAFKNVRKRLRFKNRDYLFATKDYPSALEYIQVAYSYAELFDLTCSIVSHGEEHLKVPRLDHHGRSTRFTEEIRVGVIKFDNGSRIIAFSSNPQAMAVYGGDVGLDEFARHPNAQLLWDTAQGRVTWGFDIAVWSSHCGDDTLFYQFAREARAAFAPLSSSSSSPAAPERSEGGLATPKPGEGGSIPSPSSFGIRHSDFSSTPWNLYYRVTMPDAIELGLLDVINRERNTRFTAEQFLADCRARSGQEHIYQQTYLCNPVPGGAAIVEWSAIERCRADYEIERIHLEAHQITELFGDPASSRDDDREHANHEFPPQKLPSLLTGVPLLPPEDRGQKKDATQTRLGFDVAASGQGDLSVFYIDEPKGSELWLRALLTARTEDWDFLRAVLFFFLRNLPSVQAAGDETGLGRQICWEAAKYFSSRFLSVNFSSKKHDLGFALMNQLSTGEKRFPKSHQDIAADYFALRKNFNGKKWTFTEGRNHHNPASHCDIAWAGALASEAHTRRKSQAWAMVG